MKFTKMHGAGNDYIYIDCFNQNVKKPCELSKKISDRHFGIGSDGVVLIKPSKKADCFMDIYNADGSRARMCGNAVRCTAKYIYDNRIKKKSITVDTLSGIKNVEILSDCCRVNMGNPIFNGRLIPTRYGDGIVRDKILHIDDAEYKITCVSMGNPHCITFCENIDEINLNKIGPLFERHEMFPERINTEFAEASDKNCLKMRVWERGSGETLACGTGACAVGVASVINGYCTKNEEITIQAKGGILKVLWHENDNVYLTGEAIRVFDGEI
jgi:diaminopimelate epimerase